MPEKLKTSRYEGSEYIRLIHNRRRHATGLCNFFCYDPNVIAPMKHHRNYLIYCLQVDFSLNNSFINIK